MRAPGFAGLFRDIGLKVVTFSGVGAGSSHVLYGVYSEEKARKWAEKNLRAGETYAIDEIVRVAS